jgi:hypothetical protein
MWAATLCVFAMILVPMQRAFKDLNLNGHQTKRKNNDAGWYST